MANRSTKMKNEPNREEEQNVCGLVMPISGSNGYTKEHWIEVKNILMDAIAAAGLESRMVSESDESGVIHKRIIQNLYNDCMVVCDVSSKNSNVMFELGMRLAFDKPVVIVMDDSTGFSFDTASIEHVIYRKDLRYSDVVRFKEELCKKVKATLKASQKSDYTTFLSHFGDFKVATLQETNVTAFEMISAELESQRRLLLSLKEDLREGHGLGSNKSSHTLREFLNLTAKHTKDLNPGIRIGKPISVTFDSDGKIVEPNDE